MVARDLRTGEVTRPTVVEIEGDGDGPLKVRYPRDPQINIVDSDVEEKQPTSLSGYVRGGTTNPPAGESGDVEYFDPDGKPADPQKVLSEELTPSGTPGDGRNAIAAHDESNAGKSKKKGSK